MKTEVELMNYCRSLAYQYYEDEVDREDLVQDTLCKIYSNLDKFDGKNLKGWCATIMRNLFINEYRKTIRHGEIVTDDFYDNYENYDKEVCGAVQAEYLNIEYTIKLLDKLRSIERACIKLRIKGYPYEHIAHILEIPCGTVKTSIWSARQKLTKLVGYEIPNRSKNSNKAD